MSTRAVHRVLPLAAVLVLTACGGSADDVAAAFKAIEQTRVSVNYATLFGHNTVRRAVSRVTSFAAASVWMDAASA